MEQEELKNIKHLFNRGINGRDIFKTDHDRKKFLYFIQKFRQNFHIKIYSFVLMDNHYHLLISAEDKNAKKFIRYVQNAYTGYYCERYQYRRALLDEVRIIGKPNLEWALDTFLYIINNPIEAKMCHHPLEYKWSSYRYHTKRAPRWKSMLRIDTNLAEENFRDLIEMKKALKDKLNYMLRMKKFKTRPKSPGDGT